MEYAILGQQRKIDFAPSSEVEEVLQNVQTLLCTKKFSVPLHRKLGIDFGMLDAPILKAKAVLAVEIVEALRNYEPRAKVTRVDFDGDALDGYLIPKVMVRVDA